MKSSKPIYWHCKCGETTIKGKQKITIIAMRHGESGHNVLHIVNGDPRKHFHLTAKGKVQAKELAQKLRNKEIKAIIASQMVRTQETAAPLAKLKKLKIQVDKRLNDIGAGGFEGTNIFEFKRITNQIHKSVKGSETYKGVAKRLK
ncbi:MAG TPA: histidine phosphatase family protein, partial [Candidatus Limnocylindria bacterium]|nr:histidine phosphatase family protein [Candidatus Limnocylindria bacterium]